MTIADRKSSSTGRSWLARLRGDSAVPAADKNTSHAAKSPSGHKPRLHLVDLLVMSTVDQKAPPNLAGSAALLDALVQEHLDHGIAAAPAVPDDMIAAPPPPTPALPAPRPAASDIPTPPIATTETEDSPSSPPDGEMTAEQRAAMLQREIEMLLNDAPETTPAAAARTAPPAPAPTVKSPASPELAEATAQGGGLPTALPPAVPNIADAVQAALAEAARPAAEASGATPPGPDSSAAQAEVPARPAVTAPPAPIAPPAVPAVAKDLSSEELDVLLAQESGAYNGAPAMAPDIGQADASLVGPAETEQKLSEAEGVLADELAKLLEESGTAEAPPPPPPASATPAASDAADAAATAAATPPAGTETLNPEDAALADELAKLMAAPVCAAAPATQEAPAAPAAPPTSGAVAVAAAAPPLSPSPATPAAAPTAQAAAATTASAAAGQPAAATATPNAATAAESAAKPARPGLLLRLQLAMASVLLTVAQLLDLPFGWLDDLSRNVIGMAAFLLLVGGVVLWLLSHLAILGG